MFEKYPDQSRDRRQAFIIGAVSAIVSGGSFWVGGTLFGFMFGAVALVLLPVTLICDHAGFETATKMWRFLSWFS
ncbi:hypothetical protein [Pseudomonas syringae group genomosp. 7]|uniref:hypothetical protein n=1 Tax=Pseudomonas syringae group genomosp. 7 TaxID=251699 RepID=UPI0011C3CDF3|nr:hypothetical protein [Pseudomonas syringae group genomosp. 7]